MWRVISKLFVRLSTNELRSTDDVEKSSLYIRYIIFIRSQQNVMMHKNEKLLSLNTISCKTQYYRHCKYLCYIKYNAILVISQIASIHLMKYANYIYWINLCKNYICVFKYSSLLYAK